MPTKSITLPITNGSYPQQITKDVTFWVVDFSSTNNAIIGRPTLKIWRVATSTYHLLLKFPTKYGIGGALDGSSRMLRSFAGDG